MADDEKNSKIQHIVDLLDITYAAYVSKLDRQHQLFKAHIYAMDYQRQVQALTVMERLYNRPLSQPTFKIQNIENSPTPPYKQYLFKPLTQPITPPIIATTNPNSPTPPYKQYLFKPLTQPITPPIIATTNPISPTPPIESKIITIEDEINRESLAPEHISLSPPKDISEPQDARTKRVRKRERKRLKNRQKRDTAALQKQTRSKGIKSPRRKRVVDKSATMLECLKMKQDILDADHEDVKKVKCPRCDKIRDKHTIIAHVFVHTRELPFSCKYCNTRFKRQVSVKHHLDKNVCKYFKNGKATKKKSTK